MHRGSKQTFFQRRYSGNQQTCEKMLNITNQQGNANENHNDISSYPLGWPLSRKSESNKY